MTDAAAIHKGRRHVDESNLLDEHEFYITRVGFAMAQILTTVSQIELIPLLLPRYRHSQKLAQKGIHQHVVLRYHAENYFIRIQILRDRILMLIDAVFHLLNSSRSINERSVLENLKVERTSVPSTYQKFRKIIKDHLSQRNKIVHEHAYEDAHLRYVELCFLLERQNHTLGLNKNPRGTAKEFAKEFADEKSFFFSEWNEDLAKGICELFEALAPIYKKEKSHLAFKVQN